MVFVKAEIGLAHIRAVGQGVTSFAVPAASTDISHAAGCIWESAHEEPEDLLVPHQGNLQEALAYYVQHCSARSLHQLTIIAVSAEKACDTLEQEIQCRREILRICELMKLRIFDTETNRIQSQIYYDPANVLITPENIEINISEIDSE